MNHVNYSVESLQGKINRTTRGDKIAKVENNTYCENYQDQIYITLHGNLITQESKNKIVLYSRGWRTLTTKDRINKILRDNSTGWQLYQESRIWYLYNGYEKIKFSEGITLTDTNLCHSWSVSNYQADNTKELDTKKRQIRGYIKRYIDQLNQGNINYTDSFDCRYCKIHSLESVVGKFQGVDNKHLYEHIENNEFPLYLLTNSIARFPVSILANTELDSIFSESFDGLINGESLHGITINQVTSSLTRYLFEILITNQ